MKMLTTKTLTGCLVLGLWTAGCAESVIEPTDASSPAAMEETDSVDLRDDSFLQLASSMGMDDDDPRAKAILRLANEADLATLDDSDAVGLDVRAAENIVEFRAGDDGDEGTGDDRRFTSLTQLDEVPWVGERAFEKLYEYAMAQGAGEGEDPQEPTEPAEPAGEPVHGITPGSAEATAILTVANTAGLTELDASDAVGLDARAAENIVEFRAGDDGEEGTADDQTFKSLTELDDISYVAASAFQSMLDYAIAQGLVGGDGGGSAQGALPALNAFSVDEDGPGTQITVRGQLAIELQDDIARMHAEDQAHFACTEGTSPACSFRVQRTQSFDHPDALIGFQDEREDSATAALLSAVSRDDDGPFACSGRSAPALYGGGFLSATCSIRAQSRLTLHATDAALPVLGGGYRWEGWLVEDGQPASTGKFDARAGQDAYHFVLDRDAVEDADAFVLTIEPADEFVEGLPSDAKYLGGALGDEGATLTTSFGPTLDGQTLEDAAGGFFLGAPSATPADDATYRNGVWFIDAASGVPTASLRLPELGDGWTYEGWVVRPGDAPISTGRFDAPDEADSDLGGPYAGDNDTPPFPGQDFITGSGRIDLTDGWRVVISIEPREDDSPLPFALKPLTGDITDAGAMVSQTLQRNDAGIPTATVTVR